MIQYKQRRGEAGPASSEVPSFQSQRDKEIKKHPIPFYFLFLPATAINLIINQAFTPWSLLVGEGKKQKFDKTRRDPEEFGN